MNYQELEIKLNQTVNNHAQHFKVQIDSSKEQFIVSLNNDIILVDYFYTGQRKSNEPLEIKDTNTLLYQQYLILDQFERQDIDDKLIINNIFDDSRIDYKTLAVYTRFDNALKFNNDKINKSTIRKALKMPQKDFNVALQQLFKFHYLENPKSGVHHVNFTPYQPSEIE